MMNKVIHLTETAGLRRDNEYVRVSVPCARGEIGPQAPVAIVAPDGDQMPCQSRALKEWPDGSVKWLLVDFAASLSPGASAAYRLVAAEGREEIPTAVTVVPGPEQWQVETGAGSFSLDAKLFRPFTSVRVGGKEILGSGKSDCDFVQADGSTLPALVEKVALEDKGPLHAVVRVTGRFGAVSTTGPRFAGRLHFFAGSLAVKIEFTLHNPRAARHPKGLWDLGDEGSLLFKGLGFSFSLDPSASKEIVCLPEPGAGPIECTAGEGFSIYQESSGGENWQSPNHRNREGRVPLIRRGYVVEAAGRESAAGLRATPQVWCGSEKQGLAAAIPWFWQEFPKQLAVQDGRLQVELFPARFPDLHELQGGEQKTHEFFVDFSGCPDRLAGALAPLQVWVNPAAYRESGIFGDLPGADDLVGRFTTAEAMLAKREIIDEYGWRNFGEVYADHEAALHQGEEPLVSHYNNQYDLIAGAYKKAFGTGDLGWQRLAADLARHVRDIDLYHTDLDREEYNHGLFWHTDHYCAAGLATHRSYSREQKATYELHAGGGGPGAEHCYTTGLMLHYFQTGHPDFKQAVIDLAEWELRALTGPQTVLAALKRGVGYLNHWRAARSEKPLFPRYPLTRGTGNAITACLDAFEVGGGSRFLERADHLVRQTIHPDDDIERRNLLNAEIGWSYTVFLAAVGKFLDKKVELEEFDAGFGHARASLLAYAGWMVENEYPYLDKPEILEYPNETWAAQELRKSVIILLAARYAVSEEQGECFLEKAEFFFGYAEKELPRHESSRFSRPVALMLQNGWVGGRLKQGNLQGGKIEMGRKISVGRPTPHLNAVAVAARMGGDLAAALKHTNIKREYSWLMARLQG